MDGAYGKADLALLPVSSEVEVGAASLDQTSIQGAVNTRIQLKAWYDCVDANFRAGIVTMKDQNVDWVKMAQCHSDAVQFHFWFAVYKGIISQLGLATHGALRATCVDDWVKIVKLDSNFALFFMGMHDYLYKHALYAGQYPVSPEKIYPEFWASRSLALHLHTRGLCHDVVIAGGVKTFGELATSVERNHNFSLTLAKVYNGGENLETAQIRAELLQALQVSGLLKSVSLR